MKTVCPSCGAIHSAEALFTDAEARQCIKLISEMPGGVSGRIMAYLALFRVNSGRAMQWRRVRSLLSELSGLVHAAHIQRDREVARLNSPMVWARALERILNQPPAQLPLKSHGYLHSIAYQLADEADRKKEVTRNKAERGHSISRDSSELKPMDLGTMRAIREKHYGK